MLVDSARSLAPQMRDAAAVAEELRRLPAESVAALLDSEIAKALVPSRWGGMELGLETWFDVVTEISAGDASHGWCASLLVHLPQMIAAFPEEAQAAVWSDGANVPLAGAVVPVCAVRPAAGGFRVSGQSPFSSGVDHASWVFVAGMVGGDEGPPVWTFFLLAPGDYRVEDTWNTTGMRGTGSNTIVTDDVFVPQERTLRLSDLVDGTGPGGQIHENPIYRLPFMSYGPLAFAAPILGAARGASKDFGEWAATRDTPAGVKLAEMPGVQLRLATAAADLDAAELLLRRAIDATVDGSPSVEERSRTMRDAARSAALCKGAVDELIEMSGTSGFSVQNPIQRAWRDIHFAASHISLNPEINCTHWARTQFGFPRPPKMAMY